MNKRILLFASAAVLALAFSRPAEAGNITVFDANNGQVVLPISPPTNSGATPGRLDNTAIGQTTPAPLTALNFQLDTGTKTATAVAGAATLNKSAGVVTSEALTTAAAATYTLTLTDSFVAAADQVYASVQLGTSTTGTPSVTTTTPAAGSVVIKVKNIDATNPFNGTVLISFLRIKN